MRNQFQFSQKSTIARSSIFNDMDIKKQKRNKWCSWKEDEIYEEKKKKTQKQRQRTHRESILGITWRISNNKRQTFHLSSLIRVRGTMLLLPSLFQQRRKKRLENSDKLSSVYCLQIGLIKFYPAYILSNLFSLVSATSCLCECVFFFFFFSSIDEKRR